LAKEATPRFRHAAGRGLPALPPAHPSLPILSRATTNHFLASAMAILGNLLMDISLVATPNGLKLNSCP
jgi:hypothetical protein